MSALLNCHVIRSKKRKKTISLHIKEDRRVLVYVPYRTPEREIERFINQHQSWISKKLSEREQRFKYVQKTYQPGETFFYLGDPYPLAFDSDHHRGPALRLSFGKFILRDKLQKARDLFIQWYKEEAKAKLPERVEYYGRKLQLFPKGIKITSAKSRWGSCSGDNRLSFSWRVMMAPLKVIDYILIHELVHIKEKNHSKRFWKGVESIMPDYKRQRLWLKRNGDLLQL